MYLDSSLIPEFSFNLSLAKRMPNNCNKSLIRKESLHYELTKAYLKCKEIQKVFKFGDFIGITDKHINQFETGSVT